MKISEAFEYLAKLWDVPTVIPPDYYSTGEMMCPAKHVVYIGEEMNFGICNCCVVLEESGQITVEQRDVMLDLIKMNKPEGTDTVFWWATNADSDGHKHRAAFCRLLAEIAHNMEVKKEKVASC